MALGTFKIDFDIIGVGNGGNAYNISAFVNTRKLYEAETQEEAMAAVSYNINQLLGDCGDEIEFADDPITMKNGELVSSLMGIILASNPDIKEDLPGGNFNYQINLLENITLH